MNDIWAEVPCDKSQLIHPTQIVPHEDKTQHPEHLSQKIYISTNTAGEFSHFIVLGF
jgi:hypothetical protein